MQVNYADKRSLAAFAMSLNGMLPVQKVKVARLMVENKLMNSPWYMNVIKFFIGSERYSALLNEFFNTDNKKFGLYVWQDVLNHMVQGRDAFDKRSAGGFSKQELERIGQFTRSVGFEPIVVVG